jgi:hypothetical protein
MRQQRVEGVIVAASNVTNSPKRRAGHIVGGTATLGRNMARTSSAAPATIGVAIEVPRKTDTPQVSPLLALATVPGATTSGLLRPSWRQEQRSPHVSNPRVIHPFTIKHTCPTINTLKQTAQIIHTRIPTCPHTPLPYARTRKHTHTHTHTHKCMHKQTSRLQRFVWLDATGAPYHSGPVARVVSHIVELVGRLSAIVKANLRRETGSGQRRLPIE